MGIGPDVRLGNNRGYCYRPPVFSESGSVTRWTQWLCNRSRGFICASVVCSLVGFGGCYSESSDELTFDESDLLLDEGMSSEVGKVQGAGRPSSGSPLGEGRSESGSKHALVKRVTQTLSQLTPDGIETSQAQMAAWFDVSVETMSDGELSYGVVYRRVTYSEKLPGGSQSYDSNDDTAAVPAAFANLSELTRSGFTFRTRGDRTGLELVIVPSTLLNGDRKGTAAAEFIYDRFGLVLLGRSAESLPTAPVMRTRRIVSPIPMEFSTRFAVKASGSGTITLDVFGSVATSQPTPGHQTGRWYRCGVAEGGICLRRHDRRRTQLCATTGRLEPVRRL
ncbi:MAG: hypothetical protein CM1200mP2_11080 [Planctomycetaceae bacterium]|nr:MAG: hypothetical protein CM1200mP2_11080 [Planctomycetaceae bacterium]